MNSKSTFFGLWVFSVLTFANHPNAVVAGEYIYNCACSKYTQVGMHEGPQSCEEAGNQGTTMILRSIDGTWSLQTSRDGHVLSYNEDKKVFEGEWGDYRIEAILDFTLPPEEGDTGTHEIKENWYGGEDVEENVYTTYKCQRSNS